MRQALDPGWVSKTIAKALLLAVPAVVLLARTYWNPKKKNPEAGSPFAFWVGISIVIAYCLWILDWVFQWSILFGVGAPLWERCSRCWVSGFHLLRHVGIE